MGRTGAQDKWGREHMCYQTVKVRKTLLDDFKAACAARGDRVNTVLRRAMEQYISESSVEAACVSNGDKINTVLREDVERKRYPRTEQQRQYYRAYQREYRARNKAKTQKWRNDYIIRKAAKLTAEKEQ